MRRRLAVALVVCLPSLAAAPPAPGYVERGYVWPGPSIKYWVASPGYRKPTLYAARAWNRARVGVVFRRARSRGTADVIVSRGRMICGGSAFAGYYGPAV